MYRTDGITWERIALPDQLRNGHKKTMRVYQGKLIVKHHSNPGTLFSSLDGSRFTVDEKLWKLARSFDELSILGANTLAVKDRKIKNFINRRWQTVFRGHVISFRIQDNEHFAVFEQASSKIFSRERQWVSTWDGNVYYFNTLPVDFEEWKISNFTVIGVHCTPYTRHTVTFRDITHLWENTSINQPRTKSLRTSRMARRYLLLRCGTMSASRPSTVGCSSRQTTPAPVAWK